MTRRKSMKTREETKQALRRALAEHEGVGHYLSMVECAFGVDGLTELTDTFMMLLDQVPEACKPAVSKDGRPVALGSRVWLGDREMRVVAVSHRGKVAIREWTKERGRGAFWVPADKVTVERPDTQERIDADALKILDRYWGCTGKRCTECPVEIDGKRPTEHYGVLSCDSAKTLDLLRRQRELCEKVAE